jgi:hypothetical protein
MSSKGKGLANENLLLWLKRLCDELSSTWRGGLVCVCVVVRVLGGGWTLGLANAAWYGHCSVEA